MSEGGSVVGGLSEALTGSAGILPAAAAGILPTVLRETSLGSPARPRVTVQLGLNKAVRQHARAPHPQSAICS
jgi:hypothetical protein